MITVVWTARGNRRRIVSANQEIWAAKGQIDLDKINAVAEEDIEHWKREDGIDDSQLGPPLLVIPGPNVRAIRQRLGLSQEEFARRFQLSLRTLQDWEQLLPDSR